MPPAVHAPYPLPSVWDFLPDALVHALYLAEGWTFRIGGSATIGMTLVKLWRPGEGTQGAARADEGKLERESEATPRPMGGSNG